MAAAGARMAATGSALEFRVAWLNRPLKYASAGNWLFPNCNWSLQGPMATDSRCYSPRRWPLRYRILRGRSSRLPHASSIGRDGHRRFKDLVVDREISGDCDLRQIILVGRCQVKELIGIQTKIEDAHPGALPDQFIQLEIVSAPFTPAGKLRY